MVFEIICAGLCFQFRGFSDYLPFNTWNWKLDPWKTSASSRLPEGTEVINIVSKQSPTVCREPSNLICAEKSGFFERRVFQMDNGSTLWDFVRVAKNCCYLRYTVNSDWNTVTLLKDETNTVGNASLEYLTQMMPGILLKQNMLTFHGVLLEDAGRGIVISAPSGTGKTTHARLWRDTRRSLIINGDKSTCKKADGIWTGFGLPWSGTSGEQINRSIPLTALVVLERGEENCVHHLTGLDAFGAVLPHVQCPMWDRALSDKAMELLDDFLRCVPVLRLTCRPDTEAVEVLNRALEGL